MKKLLTITLIMALSMGAYAQVKHMKFMGIPLDGTISAFQSKLVAKGIKSDTKLNAVIPVGVRAFVGDFAGNKSDIYVYYDKNTKIVYRAKACISNTDKSIFEKKYKEIKQLIQTKYDGVDDYGEQKGHESYIMYVDEGYVSVYISEDENTFPSTYIIHVDYSDELNTAKNEKSKLDDI